MPRHLNSYSEDILNDVFSAFLAQSALDAPQMIDADDQPAFDDLFGPQDFFALQPAPSSSTYTQQQHNDFESRNAAVHPTSAIDSQIPTPPAAAAAAVPKLSKASAALASRPSFAGRKVPKSFQRPANSKPRYNPLLKAATKNATAARRAAPKSSALWPLESLFDVPEYSLAPELKPYILPAAPQPPTIDEAMSSFAADPIVARPLTGKRVIDSPWAAFGANNRGHEEGRMWAEGAAAKSAPTQLCIDPTETLTAEHLERERQTLMPLAQAASEEDLLLPLEDLFEHEAIGCQHESEDEDEHLDEMNYTPVNKLWETHQYTGGPAKMHKSALDISQQVDEDEVSEDDCATDRDAFEEDEEDEDEEEDDDDDEFDPDLDSDFDD